MLNEINQLNMYEIKAYFYSFKGYIYMSGTFSYYSNSTYNNFKHLPIGTRTKKLMHKAPLCMLA